MAAKTAAVLFGLSLSACLNMPIAQERSPPLPVRADPPGPIRIYVVINEVEFSGLRPWTIAREFEVALEQAGFDAIVVDERLDVPPGVPFSEHFSAPSGGRDWPVWEWYPTYFTAGFFPTFDDRQYGWSFDLYRQRDAPVERVRARWTVPVVVGWVALPLRLFRGDELGWAEVPDEAEKSREVPALRVALLDALALPASVPAPP